MQPGEKAEYLRSKAFQNALNQILNSKTVDAFLAKEGEEQLQSLLLEGHGGAAEDKLKEYMLEQPTLTADIPSRYMPTYSSRIENLQQKLSGETPDSPEAARIYAEIFRTRRAAGGSERAGRGLRAVGVGRVPAGQRRAGEA